MQDGSRIALDITGDLALRGTLNAPAVNLIVSGAITEPGGSLITGLLTGNAASVALTSGTNSVAAVGPFTAETSFALTDGRSLAVAGAIDPPDVTLNVTGDLAINDVIAANTATLIATGAITEGPRGRVDAITLTGSANSATLDQPNAIGTLADFTTISGFLLNNAVSLQITGVVTDGSGITITTAGSQFINGRIAAPNVTLTANTGEAFRAPSSRNRGRDRCERHADAHRDGRHHPEWRAYRQRAPDRVHVGATTLASADNAVGTLAAFSSGGRVPAGERAGADPGGGIDRQRDH